jgi:multidrug efflux system membrane fusion protein
MLIAITIAGLRHFDRPAATASAPAPIPVTAATAERQNVPDIVNALGTVQSIDNVSIQARVNGPIEKIEFTPGQDVKQGQELFLIDPRPFQAALDEQQAQLAHDEGVLAEAQVDLTRYQLLAQQNSIAKQQAQDQVYVVQQDKGTVQLDQANVEAAQLNLEFCHVTAPVSGRAGVLLVDPGNLVGPSSGATSATSTSTNSTANGQAANTMVVIEQIKPIYVRFIVPQNLLDQIKHNQAIAPLGVDAYSQAGKLLEKGKLTLIDNQVNTGTGTVVLQGTFANADEVLWPGEFVRAQLIVAMRKNAVTVPTQSVMAGPDGSYVYVIGPDEKVKRVGVQVTVRQGAIAVIAKGLSGGEKVVTDGQYRLDNGTTVAVRQNTNASPGAELSEAE